jgi:quinol monooxygenase YgiN
MRMPLRLFSLAMMGAATAVAGSEVHAGPVWALTFIEVRIEARGHAASILRQQAQGLREQAASPAQIALLQEWSRPERFALLECEEQAASNGGGREMYPATEPLMEELTAPPDRRKNREFGQVAVVTCANTDEHANVYVIAHVDIAAPDHLRAEASLRQLAAAARQSAGNVRFDIWQQTDHANHFNLISGWISESQFYAFKASRMARDFRQIIGPLLDSPYDERLLRRLY